MAKFHCVVDWDKDRNRVMSYHVCSTSSKQAKNFAFDMQARGHPFIRVIERKSIPRGVRRLKWYK